MTEIDYRSTAFLIIGAGGHAQDLLEIASSMDASIFGFLDDSKIGNNIRGTLTDWEQVTEQWAKLFKMRYIIGVNSSAERERIATIMDAQGAIAGNLIHKTAIVGYNVKLGEGIVLGPYSVLTSNVVVGNHVHLNTSASINQGSSVGDFGTLGPGAKIAGDVNAGRCLFMGMNSSVINMIDIGENVTIGAGAVVIRDVECDQTVVGIPAKPIDKTDKYLVGYTP